MKLLNILKNFQQQGFQTISTEIFDDIKTARHYPIADFIAKVSANPAAYNDNYSAVNEMILGFNHRFAAIKWNSDIDFKKDYLQILFQTIDAINAGDDNTIYGVTHETALDIQKYFDVATRARNDVPELAELIALHHELKCEITQVTDNSGNEIDNVFNVRVFAA